MKKKRIKKKRNSLYRIGHYNSQSKNVINSVGNYYNNRADASNVTFVRDPEKLIVQYDNLIRSLGKKYSKYFSSYVDKEDLYSYIRDTFISLALEYDISSEVDFQGYIKRMLEVRIKASYSKPEQLRSSHITTLKSTTNSVEVVTDTKHIEDKREQLSYRLDKTSPHKITLKDGSEVGVEVKVVSVDKSNEIDDSLLEVESLLKEHDAYTIVKKELIEALVREGNHSAQTKREVAIKLGIPATEVEREYNELKNILTKL